VSNALPAGYADFHEANANLFQHEASHASPHYVYIVVVQRRGSPMKRITFAVLLLCSAIAFAQSSNPADYTITVHVTASRISRPINQAGQAGQQIQVVIGGKKYELQGLSDGVLALGDYKAKLKEIHRNSYDIYKTYEFLMPDGKIRNFNLSGILE